MIDIHTNSLFEKYVKDSKAMGEAVLRQQMRAPILCSVRKCENTADFGVVTNVKGFFELQTVSLCCVHIQHLRIKELILKRGGRIVVSPQLKLQNIITKARERLDLDFVQ